MTTTDTDVIAKFAELLKVALPAFASSISPDTRSITIRGSLPIYAGVDLDIIRISVIEGRDHVLAAQAHEVAERVRRLAIEAVNLEPTIQRREEQARRQGVIEGNALGLSRGRVEGRAQAIDSLGSWLANLPDDMVATLPWEWKQSAQDARTARADAEDYA